ncbi:hypothetical protein JTP77_044800, partial [Streptomyces sp. S9]|nr:hypothetical protein [Streptomyces sp. S9]
MLEQQGAGFDFALGDRDRIGSGMAHPQAGTFGCRRSWRNTATVAVGDSRGGPCPCAASADRRPLALKSMGPVQRAWPDP